MILINIKVKNINSLSLPFIMSLGYCLASTVTLVNDYSSFRAVRFLNTSIVDSGPRCDRRPEEFRRETKINQRC